MDKSVYIRQFKTNKGHWWFESRKSIIKSFLKSKLKKKIDILDFGCGVGINLEMLADFGNVFYYDDNKKVMYLNKNNNNFFKMKAVGNLKKTKKKFDLIVALDVIEHIDNDSKVVNYLGSLLKKNGKILITVPAYQFLFSLKDKILHHKRRYTKFSLNKIMNKKFHIIKSTYFNFFLSPAIISATLFLKLFNKNYIDSVEKKPNVIINFFFKLIFTSEKFFLNIINFPFGISILFFGEKKNDK
jgi:SAM-dependent methyltransferase